MLGSNLPTFLQRCKTLVDEAAYWANRARHWARIALTGVGIVEIEAGTESITVGTESDAFSYFSVNDDLHTVTFFLVSDAVPGTSFQIRNNGHGVVQVQPLNGGIVNSSGTLILRGHSSVISLVAIRPEINNVPAMWDLIGDVQPL
jgi:hypothetical protein